MLDYCKNTYSDCSNGLTKHKWKKCTHTDLPTTHITTIRNKLPWTVRKKLANGSSEPLEGKLLVKDLYCMYTI